MLTIIILTSIAVIALFIGFLEIRIPFIGKKNSVSKRGNKMAKTPSKSIEAFYRTIRAESWLNNIELKRASDIA